MPYLTGTFGKKYSIIGDYKINDKPDEMVKLQLSSEDILAPATFIVPKTIIRYHKNIFNLVKKLVII